MTYKQWKNDCWTLFHQLWPWNAKRLTDEQSLIYRNELLRFNVHDVQDAMRQWEKESMVMPKPLELKKIVKQIAKWSARQPVASAMAKLQRFKNRYERAIKWCGPTNWATSNRYWEYQQRLFAAGERKKPLPKCNLQSEKSRKIYLAEVGLTEPESNTTS